LPARDDGRIASHGGAPRYPHRSVLGKDHAAAIENNAVFQHHAGVPRPACVYQAVFIYGDVVAKDDVSGMPQADVSADDQSFAHLLEQRPVELLSQKEPQPSRHGTEQHGQHLVQHEVSEPPLPDRQSAISLQRRILPVGQGLANESTFFDFRHTFQGS